MTNSTRNGKQPEMVKLHSHCIVFCGWLDCEGDHGDYCERLDIANGVTGPGWARSEFWCSVIHPYIRGTVSTEHAARCEDNRNGVQLTVNVDGEVTPTRTYEGARWQELKFNLTPAEARQLAAQLVAAADNHDGVGQDRHIMHRLGKIAKNPGLTFLVRSNCAAALLRITASGRHPTPSTGWRADSVLERHGRDWPRVRQARHPFDDPSQLPLPGG